MHCLTDFPNCRHLSTRLYLHMCSQASTAVLAMHRWRRKSLTSQMITTKCLSAITGCWMVSATSTRTAISHTEKRKSMIGPYFFLNVLLSLNERKSSLPYHLPILNTPYHNIPCQLPIEWRAKRCRCSRPDSQSHGCAIETAVSASNNPPRVLRVPGPWPSVPGRLQEKRFALMMMWCASQDTGYN